MEYLTSAECAEKWNVSQRWVAIYCKEGRIEGAIQKGRMWFIPVGTEKPDEPKIECAARELEEETGFRSETLEFLMTVNTTVAFCDEQIGVYIAKDLIPSKQHLDADESIDVEEWEVKDLLEMIYTGKMTDAKTIAAILAYAQKEGIR